MPVPLRRVLIAVLFALLVSWAWFPLFEGGFRGDELRTLAEAADGTRSVFAVHGTDGHALAASSLRLSTRWLELADGWGAAKAAPLRIENALLLLLAAWMIGRFARRVLAPWCGGELARAAGWAASLVFALHPLSVASVASATSRGDLLAIPLGAGCGWAYLRGRQEQHAPSIGLALVLAVLAGLSSDLALGLCGWLAGVEFSSARRHRKLHTRLRSVAATFGAAAACVAVDTLARSVALGRFSAPRAILRFGLPDGVSAWATAAATTFERVGLLFLPVDAHVVGAWGFALAAFIALAALQPILIAARSAPRLWGWMLLAWVIALAFAELCAPLARVNPGDLRAAGTLASAVVVVSVGFAVTITALSGPRRIVLPLVIGLGYATLSHANALAYRSAARELAALAPFVARDDGARHVFVVDAPGMVLGVSACEGAVERLAPRAASAHGVTLNGLCALAREPEFEALRAEGVALVARPVAAAPDARAPWERTRLPAPKPSTGPLSFFREGSLEDLDLEPQTTRVLRVGAATGSDTSSPPVVAWRASSSADPSSASGSLQGVWSELGEAPEALFDLSGSLAWLATPRVAQAWSTSGWSRIRSAAFESELPALPVEPAPQRDGDAWLFVAPAALDGGDARRSWTLGLLDPRTYEFVELAGLQAGERLRFDGAVAHAARGLTVWTLETRVDGRAIERSRGR